MSSMQLLQVDLTVKAAQSILERRIACGVVSLDVGVQPSATHSEKQSREVDEEELHCAIQEALVTLTALACSEHLEGTSLGERSDPRIQHALGILGSVLEDDNLTDGATHYLIGEARWFVNRFWPAIQFVGDHLADQTDISDDELVPVIDEAVRRLFRARPCSSAACAVINQLLGVHVNWVALDDYDGPLEAVPDGTRAIERSKSPALENELAARRGALNEHWEIALPPLIQSPETARRINLGQASYAELAAGWWEVERAIDDTVGPVTPSIQGELGRLDDIDAIGCWVGEVAAQKASGIFIPDGAYQVRTLEDLARTSETPDDVVKRLFDARARATTLVNLHWEVIEVVAAELDRHGYLTGDRMRELITQTTPDPGRLSE